MFDKIECEENCLTINLSDTHRQRVSLEPWLEEDEEEGKRVACSKEEMEEAFQQTEE